MWQAHSQWLECCKHLRSDYWSSCCGSGVKNQTSIHEDVGSILGIALWVKDLVLPWAVVWVIDQAWIWLWLSLAAAALIWPLAWELPYAAGVALKRKKSDCKQYEKVYKEFIRSRNISGTDLIYIIAFNIISAWKLLCILQGPSQKCSSLGRLSWHPSVPHVSVKVGNYITVLFISLSVLIWSPYQAMSSGGPVFCCCWWWVFLVAPTAYGSSWARDWIWVTALTYAMAAPMPDP